MTDPRETFARARGNTPSVFLDGIEQDPAHHPHPDSAQVLNEYHARYESALEDESLDPLTRAELRTRVRFGRPFSGDLATFVRASTRRLLDALEAVLALHSERAESACDNPAHTVPDTMCPECRVVCDNCYEDWPCPTVAAITTALEGETHD